MTGHALTTMLESEAGYITHTHTHTHTHTRHYHNKKLFRADLWQALMHN